jgi:alpha-tubulin suppressor-like RCC1 family protein
MTTPDANGKPNEEIISEFFLKPAPPNFAGELPSDKMIVTDIACGGNHLLVIARTPGGSASQVYSSGLNNYGQLGHGDANEGNAVNTNRHELTLVSTMSVKAFELQSCAMHPNMYFAPYILQVEALEDKIIVKVEAGAFHSMALDFSGNLYAFGRSDQGQLGIDTRMPNQERITCGAFESLPKIVVFPGGEPVLISDVACGDNHTLVITKENEVYSWGYGDTGPTGHATEDDEDIIVPTKLDLSTDGQPVLTYQIAAGGQHTLLVTKPSA